MDIKLHNIAIHIMLHQNGYQQQIVINLNMISFNQFKFLRRFKLIREIRLSLKKTRILV